MPATKAPATADKSRRDSHRLARRLMPFIAADSALLPPDRWILSNVRAAYKTVPPFRRDVRAAGALVGAVAGLVVTVAASLVTVAVIGTVTLAVVGISAVATLAGAAAAWWRGRHIWQRAQADTLPAMKQEMGKRYVAYKTEEIMREWRVRVEAKRAAKAAATAATLAPAPVTSAPTSPTPSARASLRDLFRPRSPAATPPVSPDKPPAKPPAPPV